ncbi:unnamed protein product [Ectocarpus sp. CCAP 1310/34]|nr:unnamed protein product [Ectocarpus sp. CCAP 1310/34]
MYVPALVTKHDSLLCRVPGSAVLVVATRANPFADNSKRASTLESLEEQSRRTWSEKRRYVSSLLRTVASVALPGSRFLKHCSSCISTILLCSQQWLTAETIKNRQRAFQGGGSNANSSSERPPSPPPSLWLCRFISICGRSSDGLASLKKKIYDVIMEPGTDNFAFPHLRQHVPNSWRRVWAVMSALHVGVGLKQAVRLEGPIVPLEGGENSSLWKFKKQNEASQLLQVYIEAHDSLSDTEIMEQQLDELQLSDEQRNVIDALIKEQVKIKVEEAAAAEHPATQSEGMSSEGGDTQLERPAGSESSPRPEDQPRSPADVSLIHTLARALQRVKIKPDDEYSEVPTPKESIRISAGIAFPAFTGKFSSEDDVQTAVMVFTSQFRSLLEQERCLGAIESKKTIRVGNTDANISALKVEHGTEAVDRAVKAWQLIISKIQVPTIVPAILASGCPTESWDQFLNFYRVYAERDKLELQGQLYTLKQQVGEEPRRYLTRASAPRQKLEAYGWVQSDHDANVHYVRNLMPDFNVQRSVLLAHSEVKTELVEKVILTTWAETEAARKRASESVGAYALVTGGDNRGGGGGNMGDRGKTRGQWRTAARQQQQQPKQPQQQHQPGVGEVPRAAKVRATAEGTGPSMGAGVFLEEDVISSSRQEEG